MNIFRRTCFLFLVSQLDVGFFILLLFFQLCSTAPFFSSVPSRHQLTGEDRSGRPFVCLSPLFLSVSIFKCYCFCSCKLIFSLFPVCAFHILLFSPDAFHPKGMIRVLSQATGFQKGNIAAVVSGVCCTIGK